MSRMLDYISMACICRVQAVAFPAAKQFALFFSHLHVCTA
jgi:hypothetical protein